tara:strand:+ start:920 stop:1327 length:408 start_codon:yes stop_codon:yes gene_type:complete
MAARTATVKGIRLVRGDDSAMSAETDNTRTHYAEVSLANDTASTVIGGTDTLDLDLSTGIQNSRRDGKTVTVRSAAVCIPALVGSTFYTATNSLSSNTISLTPKLAADWTTNATLPANTTATNRPFTVLVVYTVA